MKAIVIYFSQTAIPRRWLRPYMRIEQVSSHCDLSRSGR